MEKMKAWIYHDYKDEEGQPHGRVELTEIDKPICGDDNALLKVDVASICGTDVGTLKHGGANHKVFEGMEFGHELCGTIVETGKDVTDFKVGDRVWPFPMFVTKAIGQKSGAVGGFSEYVLIENVKKNFSLFSTDGLSNLEASLIEPFTVGFHAASRTQPGPGKNALIFGAGCIGIASAVCCAYKGCDKVAIVGRRPDKMRAAEDLGFKTFSTLDANWKDQVREYFGPGRTFSGQSANINCCIEATANADVFAEIIPLVNFGCKIGAVSSYDKEIHFNATFLAFAELEILGCAGQRHNDAFEVIEMMRSKKFDVEKVVNWIGKQEDLMTGVAMMQSGKACKSCIDFTGTYL